MAKRVESVRIHVATGAQTVLQAPQESIAKLTWDAPHRSTDRAEETHFASENKLAKRWICSGSIALASATAMA